MMSGFRRLDRRGRRVELMDVGPLTGQMVDLLVEEADREVVGLGGDVLRQPMKAGPQSAGSSIVCTAWGSDDTTCSGFMMRSSTG